MISGRHFHPNMLKSDNAPGFLSMVSVKLIQVPPAS